MSDLPAGWLETTLGEVVDYGKTEKVEPKNIPANAWILELEDIEKDTSRLLQRLTIEQRESKSTKNAFQKGDVLYGKLRPYLNKVIMADDNGFCTTEIIPIKPNTAIDGRYLFYWLKTPEFLSYVNSVSYGLNMPRLGTKDGLAAPLVLAPLDEQKRIAEKLDSLLTRVDSCQSHLERVPQILKRFRQSVLAAVVTGRLSENNEKEDGQDLPKGWRWVKLTEITSQVKDADHKMPKPAVSDIPYVSTKDFINHDDIDFENAKHISEEDFISLTKKIKPEYDDILLSRYGTVGEVRKVKTNQRFQASYSIAIIKPIHDLVLTDFLVAVLRSDVGQEQMRQNIRASSQPDLGLENIRKFNIPLPPIEEQAEIVRRAEKLFAYAERLEARYTSASERVARLTPSLLAKAFRGELVEQEVNDE